MFSSLAILSGLYVFIYFVFLHEIEEQSYTLTYQGFNYLIVLPLFSLEMMAVIGLIAQSYAYTSLSSAVRKFFYKIGAFIPVFFSVIMNGSQFLIETSITVTINSNYFVPFLFMGLLFAIGFYPER